MSKCKPATKEELKWIERFKKLAKSKPNKLWMFAVAGEMWIMKYPVDGNIITSLGGIDPINQIDIIDIDCDGGDW